MQLDNSVSSAVGAPILVEGEVWGVVCVSRTGDRVPAGTEQRLEDFTTLIGTAIGDADSRDALARLADEQAALRRVATLVARGTEPVTVFHAVCSETQVLLGADIAAILRFHLDRTVTVMATSGEARQHGVGTHLSFDPGFVVDWVHETQQAARFDTDDPVASDMPEVVRLLGLRSAVGSPIVVDGELWGVITLASVDRLLPLGMERRLADFTALVATAIANAENKSELSASRRRIVAASDESRRRIERDLHDGTQQRLVSLGLAVRAAEASLPPGRDDLRAQLSGVAAGLVAAVEDLQEISRGIHPAILSKGGLGPALQVLAHRSAIPVDLDIDADVRLEEPIEIAAYFVASEALANAAKHSEASRIDVALEEREGRLVLSVRDDGVGGADAGRGSGLVGLTDRVEALGGSIRVSSWPGKGTQITAELPLELEVPQPS
jgi:signal transduction histidine kinase